MDKRSELLAAQIEQLTGRKPQRGEDMQDILKRMLASSEAREAVIEVLVKNISALAAEKGMLKSTNMCYEQALMKIYRRQDRPESFDPAVHQIVSETLIATRAMRGDLDPQEYFNDFHR